MNCADNKISTIYLSVLLIVCTVIASCSSKKEELMFELMNDTGISFTNTVRDNDSINILSYRNFYNGGGVAVGDINNDGLSDVFFTANQGANKLFINKGNWKFDDISTKAGFSDKQQYSTGVVMVDVNNDGWLDIYVSNAGSMHSPALRKNQLYINNHDLSFTESAEKYGLADDGYTTQSNFFDYDNDGDLDCFIINNSPIPVNSLNYPRLRDVIASEWNVPEHLKGGGDHLYRNDGGHFTEVTKQAGIHGTLMSFGLGVTVGDVNGDHYPDIYISNDFFERDYLYINQQNGTFKDEMPERLQHVSYASMGADIADINNDGYPEIFTTDMLPADDYRLKTTLSFDDIDQYRLKERNDFHHQFLQNTLQLNNKNGKYTDIAHYSGVAASEWSWGALMFDADNDGYEDIYISNGIYRDLTNQDFLEFDANEIQSKMLATGKKNLDELLKKIPSIAVPNKMFRNKGNLQFDDIGTRWGLTENSFSNGAAYGDLDNDGDLDVVVNNVNEPAFIFRNNSSELNKHNYLSVVLKGDSHNPFGVGAKIIAYAGGQQLSREVIPSRGFQSSVDYKQIIGIGKNAGVDSLLIIWPNRNYTKIISPVLNKLLNVAQTGSEKVFVPVKNANYQSFFTSVASSFDKHVENDFTDFYNEKAIPQMLSAEGPRAAVADVNSDGLEDIFIGGSAEKVGQLYLQLRDGKFSKKEIPQLQTFLGFEDGAVSFFDADKDGDKDLLLGAGGNTIPPSTRELQHRLFMNDGKGNFVLSANSFPLNQDNIGAVAVYDFDNDGDEDIFTGARCVTAEYGVTPLSHIYTNNGKGIFSEMPEELTAGISRAGMITGAVWTDVDKDNKKELVICGEWMAPRIFKYVSGRFTELKTNLSALTGMWQTVETADMNNDGNMDLILGNAGENFYLHPTAEAPIKLWMKDFDNNGRTDKLITRTTDGKDKPVFMKKETADGLPILKKQSLRNKEFAQKSIQELFSSEQLKNVTVKTCNYSSSVIAYGNGKGVFDIKPLGLKDQLSSVKAVLLTDINSDGLTDMITAGNEFNFQPQLGRLDGSTGNISVNAGHGVLKNAEDTALYVTGQTRALAMIRGKQNRYIVFLRNNDAPVLFTIKSNGVSNRK